MKKFIMMVLTLCAFALVVGCGKSEKEKKADCDKDDKKVWNEDNKECEDKPVATTQAECEKDPTQIWKEEKCEARGKEECTEDGTEWKEEKCQKVASADKYTITAKVAKAVTVTSEKTVTLAAEVDKCAVVTADQVAKLKVEVAEGTAKEVLCDNTDTDTANNCEAKNYEVKAKSPVPTDASVAKNELAEVATMSENCEELK